MKKTTTFTFKLYFKKLIVLILIVLSFFNFTSFINAENSINDFTYNSVYEEVKENTRKKIYFRMKEKIENLDKINKSIKLSPEDKEKFKKVPHYNKRLSPLEIQKLKKVRDKRHLEMKDRTDKLKIDFENKKKIIIKEYENWKITREETIKLLNQEKERLRRSHMDFRHQHIEKLRYENIERLKKSIYLKLEPKFKQIEKSPIDKQKIYYKNMINKLSLELKKKDLDSRKKLLYILFKEILNNKNNTLK